MSPFYKVQTLSIIEKLYNSPNSVTPEVLYINLTNPSQQAQLESPSQEAQLFELKKPSQDINGDQRRSMVINIFNRDFNMLVKPKSMHIKSTL